jgi:hypothetical protein
MGDGIELIGGVQNVTIKTGTIQDFYYGISRRVSAVGAST